MDTSSIQQSSYPVHNFRKKKKCQEKRKKSRETKLNFMIWEHKHPSSASVSDAQLSEDLRIRPKYCRLPLENTLWDMYYSALRRISNDSQSYSWTPENLQLHIEVNIDINMEALISTSTSILTLKHTRNHHCDSLKVGSGKTNRPSRTNRLSFSYYWL